MTTKILLNDQEIQEWPAQNKQSISLKYYFQVKESGEGLLQTWVE